ncbi:uncharacterized protein LOC113205376 isoform X2 [Frankliniella occidentalis]|uniref:Uncharacterized protein LOC113205376 isoform X2 n=1 Tax=Frankliniella occidentalis TaxID=133901 RepID=A0A9C6XV41_FRAOC|nr:uncharacterized protein LOC113205376 isoform X2 [Frankliniella occidentalis]
MDLKCDICFFNFDLNAHRPKNLPCGHTICKECVENPALGKKCPTCRKAFRIRRFEDLPDSFLTIRLLEDEHAPLCKKLRTEDPELEQLQRGADAGRKVVEILRRVVPLAVESLNRQLESSVAQLGKVEEAVQRREQREPAGVLGTASDAVEEPLQLAQELEASHRLLTSTKCTVTAEEEGGNAWTASVQPGGCGDILPVLLLQLRADGQLGKVDDTIAEPRGPAAAYVGPPLISVLWINEKHLDNGRLKVSDILRDIPKKWSMPRSMKYLTGDGSDDLLRVMGAHLEELVTSGDVQPCVMEEHGRLLWLEVSFDVDHKPTMLSLIRANASSLQELRIFCAFPTDSKGNYFPDLGQELAACDLRTLRRLVLVRPVKYPCTDQTVRCVLERRTIQSALPTCIDVVCKSCHTPEI